MVCFGSSKARKALEQQNAQLEEQSRSHTTEAQKAEAQHHLHESELAACGARLAAAEERAKRADAARKEARAALSEAQSQLATQVGEEEEKQRAGASSPRFLGAEARAEQIRIENGLLQDETKLAIEQTEEAQRELDKYSVELGAGAAKFRAAEAAHRAEILKSRTQLAALELEGSKLQAKCAEKSQRQMELRSRGEEAERLLEGERREGERLVSELSGLRDELRRLWADYWTTVPDEMAGADVDELRNLKAAEHGNIEHFHSLESQLFDQQKKRAAIIARTQRKREHLSRQLAQVQEATAKGRPLSSVTGGLLLEDLQPNIQSQSQRKDSISAFGPDPVIYARGPHGMLLTPGMHIV